jgi:hypothetical protein
MIKILKKESTELKYDSKIELTQYYKEEKKRVTKETNELLSRFRSKIEESGIDLKSMFEKLDLNKNGSLSKLEIEASFPVLGIWASNKDTVKVL